MIVTEILGQIVIAAPIALLGLLGLTSLLRRPMSERGVHRAV